MLFFNLSLLVPRVSFVEKKTKQGARSTFLDVFLYQVDTKETLANHNKFSRK